MPLVSRPMPVPHRKRYYLLIYLAPNWCWSIHVWFCCQDQLAMEMYTFVGKETELSHCILEVR